MPSNAPSPLLWPSNKIASTKCNLSLGTTCMVVEDGSDCKRIKRKGGNENFLVQIKYMHIIQNTGAIDYSLNIVSLMPNKIFSYLPSKSLTQYHTKAILQE